MKRKRIEREKQTVNSMIALYCKRHHKPIERTCDECNSLIQYSNARLDKCVFGSEKPVCSKCPVHCYKAEMREKIREVMRYAGPRMMFRHPRLALLHVVDKFRNKNVDNLAKSQKLKTNIQS
ncbi:MAG: nitrous oxide-stimulated promoter family protein [Bacteroidales bacterium]|nr:nitrous oxide-stimulated promoter family protein [Bacteroidales bacterium]MCF8402836.1 nitrous oxide-stimulated promoter family protein [Bacteroidales bacterium]